MSEGSEWRGEAKTLDTTLPVSSPPSSLVGGAVSGGGGLRTEVDREGHHALLEGARGVGEHGEVLEVELHLPHDLLTLGALDGRDPASPHRRRPLSEPRDHGLRVELLGHEIRVPTRQPSPRGPLRATSQDAS